MAVEGAGRWQEASDGQAVLRRPEFVKVSTARRLALAGWSGWRGSPKMAAPLVRRGEDEEFSWKKSRPVEEPGNRANSAGR